MVCKTFLMFERRFLPETIELVMLLENKNIARK